MNRNRHERRPSFTRDLLSLGVAGALGFGVAAEGAAAPAAGRVIYARGQVEVAAADGTRRPARKGDAVSSGDTLETGVGRAQIRFTDGGFAALAPRTAYRIDDYRYAGREDGNERSFFRLLKGGVRFITGAIGRSNRSNYRIQTAVATIGIRGTSGTALDCTGGSSSSACAGLDDFVYINTTSGSLGVTSGGREYTTNVGSALACGTDGCSEMNQGTPLKRTELDLDDERYRGGDERNGGGFQCAIAECGGAVGRDAVRRIAKYAFASGHADLAFDGGEGLVVTDVEVSGEPDDTDRILIGSLVGSSSTKPDDGVESFNRNAARLVEEGAEQATGVRWGRWFGDWDYLVDGGEGQADLNDFEQSFHYVFSDLVTPEYLVPTMGMAAYDNLVGGTHPTLIASPELVGRLTEFMVVVDFGANRADFSLGGEFADGAVTFALGSGFSDVADRFASLGGQCQGGPCGSGKSLNGVTFFNFAGGLVPAAGGDYEAPQTIFGAYGAESGSGGITITGTYVGNQGADTSLPPPAPPLIVD